MMYIKSGIISLLCIFCACNSGTKEEVLNHIIYLEYSRSDSSGVFDPYLESGGFDVKIRIIDAIAKIQDPAHLPSLQKLLAKPDLRYVDKIIFALGQIHTSGSVEILKNLYFQDAYRAYRGLIIKALGKTEISSAREFMAAQLYHMPDSLLDRAIVSLALLFPRDSVFTELKRQLADFLRHPAAGVSAAAAYFFSRHPDSLAAANLIRCAFPPNTMGYKYRLRALDRIFTKYGLGGIDTLLLDSLKTELTGRELINDLPWTGNLYRLSLLAKYPDSSCAALLAGYLQADSPHLRTAAIHALGRMKIQQAYNILIANFDRSSWLDKGEIILTLAGAESQLAQPQLVNFLIQNNLDKGPVHFKQLLLTALAETGTPAAVQQLRQFLQVPDKRLAYTAYTGLEHCNQLQAADIETALYSGDLALVVSAAEWIISHPEVCTFQDVQTAYSKLSEPADLEAMMSLLEAGLKVDSVQAYQLLWQTAENTASPALANRANDLLKKAGRNGPPVREGLKLFVAGGVERDQPVPNVLIRTEKGIIEIELWSDLAPATVANFLTLVRKKFYDNLTFHRVVADFVIQGGDPRGDGWGSPGYQIPCEYNTAEFKRGTLGMATAGKDTGGSQFFICHSDQPHLNGRYTAFGRVQRGMEIVDTIEIDDKILEITIKARGVL
jgi:cyclophilin family peptidyl-prolyl cis-trans isomerase/HEAT repeat protein